MVPTIKWRETDLVESSQWELALNDGKAKQKAMVEAQSKEGKFQKEERMLLLPPTPRYFGII